MFLAEYQSYALTLTGPLEIKGQGRLYTPEALNADEFERRTAVRQAEEFPFHYHFHLQQWQPACLICLLLGMFIS